MAPRPEFRLMPMTIRLSTVAFGAALAGSACSGPGAEGPDAAAPAPAEGRYGLVVLSHDYDDFGVQVSGQFVHYRGPARAEVLHALALPENAWLVGGRPAPGECRAVGSRPAALDEAGSIDLMGAGNLRITPPEPLDTPMVLAPREFPYVHFAMSGVVYDADAPQQLPYLARGHYRVEAPGDAIGGFRGEVTAPTAVRLKGADFEAGGLSVRWDGAGPAVVTLSRDVGSRTVGVQCASAGEEGLQVPWDMLRALGAGAAQLSVARVSTAPLRAPGLDDGDVVFVARDTAEVRIPEVER
jgi:hypothetical protein